MKAHFLFGLALMGLTFLSSCGLRSRSSIEPLTEDAHEVADQVAAVVGDKAIAPSDPAASYITELSTAAYRIQTGDQLTVFFPGAPEQQFDALVRPDGRITLPAFGDMQTAGLTTEELSASITEAYGSLLMKPRAVVSVTHSVPANFYVFGEVSNPAVYSYTTGLDLMGALSTAGGVQRTASLSNIIVLRVNPQGVYSYQVHNLNDMLDEDMPMPIWLAPRDIVVVPSSTIADIGIWVDQYINTFLPPIDTFLRGRYYWRLADDTINN